MDFELESIFKNRFWIQYQNRNLNLDLRNKFEIGFENGTEFDLKSKFEIKFDLVSKMELDLRSEILRWDWIRISGVLNGIGSEV